MGGGEGRGTRILLGQPIECCYGGPNWRDGFSCDPPFKKLSHLFLSQSLEDGRYHRIQSIYSLGLEKYYKPAFQTNKSCLTMGEKKRKRNIVLEKANNECSVGVWTCRNASAWLVYNESLTLYDKACDLSVKFQWEFGSLFRAPTQTHTPMPWIYGHG